MADPEIGSRQLIIWLTVCQKLHENVMNWTEWRRRGELGICLLDSPVYLLTKCVPPYNLSHILQTWHIIYIWDDLQNLGGFFGDSKFWYFFLIKDGLQRYSEFFVKHPQRKQGEFPNYSKYGIQNVTCKPLVTDITTVFTWMCASIWISIGSPHQGIHSCFLDKSDNCVRQKVVPWCHRQFCFHQREAVFSKEMIRNEAGLFPFGNFPWR